MGRSGSVGLLFRLFQVASCSRAAAGVCSRARMLMACIAHACASIACGFFAGIEGQCVALMVAATELSTAEHLLHG